MIGLPGVVIAISLAILIGIASALRPDKFERPTFWFVVRNGIVHWFRWLVFSSTCEIGWTPNYARKRARQTALLPGLLPEFVISATQFHAGSGYARAAPSFTLLKSMFRLSTQGYQGRTGRVPGHKPGVDGHGREQLALGRDCERLLAVRRVARSGRDHRA